MWRCSLFAKAFQQVNELQRVGKPDQNGGLLGGKYSTSVVVNVCNECGDQRSLLSGVSAADRVLDLGKLCTISLDHFPLRRRDEEDYQIDQPGRCGLHGERCTSRPCVTGIISRRSRNRVRTDGKGVSGLVHVCTRMG